jgi:dihydroneopterin aldolase / 2-amino-4-hydroxy-6-hydroxymethyldihydropteridine diphosphokinase
VSDRVELRGLRARGRHGVLRAERELGQEFLADLVLHLDTRTAAVTDDLADAVDYSLVAADVHAVLAGEPVDLLEALAQRVAEAALAHPGVAQVDVAVHKPQAPVGVPFEDVVVRVRRRRGDLLDAVPARAVPVVLALGANAGDPAAALASAVAQLAEAPELEGLVASPVLETDPVGGPAQPDYLNAVVRATTTASPRDVLRACQRVEGAHGRDRRTEERWGPRRLDVDLVTYGRLVAADDGDPAAGVPALALPHPRAAGRAFVLVPWALLAPDDVLPRAGRVGDLAAALGDPAPGVRARPDVHLPAAAVGSPA